MSGHTARGELLLEQGRARLALAEFRLALADDPDSHDARLGLVRGHLELGEVAAAGEALTQALARDPESPGLHLLGGVLALREGRPAEAIARATEALRFAPNSPAPHTLLAGAHAARHDWSASLASSEAGLAHDPTDAHLMALHAQALGRLGRTSEALDATAEALRRGPDDALSQAAHGWALLEKRRPREALAAFRESLRLDPTGEWARAGMLEAMRARNWFYRQFLGYLFRLQRLTPQAQFGLIIGVYLVQRTLAGYADPATPLGVAALALMLVVLGFGLVTWFAKPLTNLILLSDRTARHALSGAEKWQARVVGLAVPGAVALGLATLAVEPIYDEACWPNALLLVLAAMVAVGALDAPRGKWRYGLLAVAVFILGCLVVNAIGIVTAMDELARNRLGAAKSAARAARAAFDAGTKAAFGAVMARNALVLFGRPRA